MSFVKQRPPTLAQRGLTLIELMVVVIIVGVLMMAAVPLLQTKPGIDEASNQIAGVLREAARKAVAGGPVANGDSGKMVDGSTDAPDDSRARLVIDYVAADDTQWVTLEVLREVNATTSQWFEYSRAAIPNGVEVYGFHNSSVMTPGAVPVGSVTELKRPSDTSPALAYKDVYCYTYGSCDAVTFYVQDTDGVAQTRVAIMPLLGSPQIFRNW